MRVCAWNGKTLPQLKNKTCVFAGICVCKDVDGNRVMLLRKKEGVYPQGGDKDYKRIFCSRNRDCLPGPQEWET